MQNAKRKLSGYSLSEVLVVMTAMGVLSSMGVVGFQRLVSYTRTKDAALNTANFLEHIAHEANRTSETMCIVKAPGDNRKILVYQSDGTPGCHGTLAETLTLDPPNEFVDMSACGLDNTDDWLSGNKGEFVPHFGLSAAPREGGVCIKGGGGTFGLAIKEKTVNAIKPRWKSGDEWQNL